MRFRVLPKYGFYSLGVFCLVLGTQHAIFEVRGLETAVETFIILSISTLVFFSAHTLPNREISLHGQWRALWLSVAFTVGFMLLAFAVWLTWSISGPSTEFSFLISFAGVLGAAVGTRASFYSVEANERLNEAQELSKLLKINQRVLRHNIRNELSIALGYLDELETSETSDDMEEKTQVIHSHLHDLLSATERTQRIVSIWESDTRTDVDLTELVNDQRECFNESHPGIEVRTDLPEKCLVYAHPAISLAIEEAIENAVEHNTPTVTVSVSILIEEDDTKIVEIADTGEGMSEADWEAIEQPEETPLVHAEGLGLWIIYWAMNMSGGSVEFAANNPQGAIIRLIFPPESSLLSRMTK